MLFNSFKFLMFFPIVVGLYFMIPYRFRWVWLLGASYYFYMSWKPEYIILILISTIIDYYASHKMGSIKEKEKRKKYLILSLFTNLGLLFLFKYYNFFQSSLGYLCKNFQLNVELPTFKLLLPVGISFYTFQTLSYTIDVYKGKIEPERHFGIFALYVSFFPQLVAGPIERSKHLLPQFYKKHKFDLERISDGLVQMAWGFFKKIVIADRLAILVDNVYNNVYEFQGIQLIIATIFFGFQIYCDFSGYSDIAIGLARIMGFDLMKNFNKPYFAKSIPEFWRRWHISLSTWFKDYLYIPLGGNRVNKWRWTFNLFITFIISGLWHGANWTFVIWGGLHGLYQIISINTKNVRNYMVKFLNFDKIPLIYNFYRRLVTFSLINFAWIFFRANNFNDAKYVVNNLFVGLNNIFNLQWMKDSISSLGFSKFQLVIAVALIGFMETIHILQGNKSITDMISSKPIIVRWAIYYTIIFGIIILGVYGYEEKSQFIYFQF
ncbi:MAG: MBOAT family protein [Firmicutes bacterium]|nr:MBOAT family protein [Bacillota bacterium]